MFNRHDSNHLDDAMWVSAVLRFCGVPDVNNGSETNKILIMYSDKSRSYHTMEHIRDMVDCWERLMETKPLGDDKHRAIMLAILFHDIVYDTKWTKHIIIEEASAQEFDTFVTTSGITISSESIEYTKNLIRSTATHTPIDRSYDTLAFLDADMAILSVQKDMYLKYTEAVRKEWAHIDSATYNRGRTAFLMTVLETPCIYYTDNMLDREEVARNNMRDELKSLDPTAT